MKFNFKLKKNIGGFQPALHWEIILVSSFVLLLLSVAYGVYLYTFAKKQIETVASIESTVPSAKLSAYASPEKIQGYFQIYKEREDMYEEILNTLIAGNKVEVSIAATTTTVVATSSNQ